MLKSDYASELMLAKMEIHRLRIENHKLSVEAGKRLLLFPFGMVFALILLRAGDLV